MAAFSIDLSGDVEELVGDYIDGRIAVQRLADPTDPMISSTELRRRLADD